MKYLKLFLFAITMLLAASVSFGQGSRTPYFNKWEAYSQMWNVSSTTWYYGTVTSSNLGNQLDTGASGADVVLSSSYISFSLGVVNTDTAILTPINGFGIIEFNLSCLKASATTCTVTATVQSSPDGLTNWATVPGVTTATVVCASTTVPLPAKWCMTYNYDRFYRVYVTGDGSHAYSAAARYIIKNYQTIQK